MKKDLYLGIELGSTRIKAVAIDENFKTAFSGDYLWKSDYINGIWTYPLEKVWEGMRESISQIQERERIAAIGISGMMHGYLAFDSDWNLLAPFRTWQNTVTRDAAEKLTELFRFNIPQRWSIAHLYKAILDEEPHVKNLAHITTLSGYVHYMLTGVNAVGIGEASGMFPVDNDRLCFDNKMLDQFETLISDRGFTWKLRDLLPEILTAGENAGYVTERGSALMGGLLTAGIPAAPPEGDAGTGMVSTNAIAPGTGNVSAGTSIFSMVVLDRALKKHYPEIDMVATPAGRAVAMVHCNNGTNDLNAWIGILKEAAELFGAKPELGDLYTKLFQKSLEGDEDCAGVLVCNYLAGEVISGVDEGRPLVVRRPDSRFTLANFLRAQLYSTMATLKTGMQLLADEGVEIRELTGHGGLFKTPVVGQKYMAAACGADIICLENAGEGGPYGMALLAAYRMNKGSLSLEQYLNRKVFTNVVSTRLHPEQADVDGFNRYMDGFTAMLELERRAAELKKV